jgi:predicted AlkP superfamily phosphohydrolase/phosphomutase
VPKAPLVHDLNGVQIVDWGTHDPEYPLSTWPPELAAEVAARFGRDTIGNCDADGRSPAEFEALRDALLDRVARKAALTGDLLGRGDWDCFLTVFSESHCAGHQCWHLHDPSHPRHDPSVARAVGNPIRDVYRAIDAALGRLLSDVSSDTTVVLLASHGMGPHYDGTFMLDDILQRLEGFNPLPTHPRLARGLRWGWSRLPAGLRERLRSLATRVKGQVGRREVPLGERRFFQAPNNDVYGAIRINLAGREPAGRVAPGDEYDACCAMLTRELMTFVNRETGAPLVRRVFRTSEVYHGDDMHHLPDLLVEWNRTTPVRVVESPKTGAIERLYSGCRTGDHKSEGLFFVLGPDIRPGAIGQAVSVMDFAPTLSELCGVELTGIDGESFLPLVRADRVGFALGSDARG